MKLKCAILDDYQKAALTMADWTVLSDAVEVTAIHRHLAQEDEVAEALRDYDIVVAMRERTPFPDRLLARLDRLKLLITSGMRNASIDVAAAARRGIAVCGTGSCSEPPAELAWALILGLARGLMPESQAMRAGGPWQQTIGMDLNGSTLGLLGLGKIGGRMARIAQAFGMKVVAWSQNLTPDKAEAAGVRLAASKEELLAESDFVSIHLVLSDRTRGLIGAEELARMRPSAYLINTSRAPIVDREALVNALRAGRIAGAGLDVFEIEPLPADDPLRTLPSVLATPHLGYVTRNNYEVYFREAVEDIAAFLAGAPIRQLS
ncbi:D-2-hydroxyacid dehydrogenase family protein [Cohnella nanjingensis]|uniref:D-2-hydroxyacid dehydrogenase family protein n=1 Tax=Cohnella nanjingensis TaxID=1387779 RepID=A0A7X0RLR1_9BACL|nr:D-2-hydroxyacid dehydrogenase family protein [Cohnella nanjingensis]MBB6669613.1 D-2-hydroxyacid dehydrogenase family protein [Cohnella nanjingensis]